MKAATALTCAFTICHWAWLASGVKVNCDNAESINEQHIHYCCRHPDGHDGLMEACAQQTGFTLPNPEEQAIVDFTADRAIAATCFGKCIFAKLNIMAGDELNMDAVRQYYNAKHAEDAEYAKEMINAFDHCHGKSEDNTAKLLANPIFSKLSQQFCAPKSSVIWACVIRQFFHNCPADRWSKTKECEQTLAFSRSCNDTLATL